MVREACLSRRLSPIVVAVASLLTAGLISCFHDHFCYIFTCLTHHNRLCYCDGWNVSLETKEKALQDQKDLCGYCRGYESVDRVSDVSCEEFMQVYGLTGRPVIVTDAMKDWNVSALVEGLQNMSLQTYRNLYKEAVDLGTIDEVFGSFFDILSSPADASPDRERYSTPEKFFTTADDVIMNDTWYINWITNEKAIYDYLNQAVKDPYFFAPWSTHASTYYFFIGRLAEDMRLHGRRRHVDSMKTSGTWHGQLLGEKEWQLWPARECQNICPLKLTINVHKGEMIFFNADLWEHETSLPARSTEHQFSFSIAKDYFLSIRSLLRCLPGDPFEKWLVPWHYTFHTSTSVEND